MVTGGTNTGVMKHVGEALQRSFQFTEQSGHYINRIPCIGIATWGIVNERQKLRKTKETVCYTTNSKDIQGACLDNNHTHFLLVDDGYINKYGGEIKFRGQLEHAIREMAVAKSKYYLVDCIVRIYLVKMWIHIFMNIQYKWCNQLSLYFIS